MRARQSALEPPRPTISPFRRHELPRSLRNRQLARARLFRRGEPRRRVGAARISHAPLRRSRADRPLPRAARRPASAMVVSDRVRRRPSERTRLMARAQPRRARRARASEHQRRAARPSRQRALDRPFACAESARVRRLNAQTRVPPAPSCRGSTPFVADVRDAVTSESCQLTFEMSFFIVRSWLRQI